MCWKASLVQVPLSNSYAYRWRRTGLLKMVGLKNKEGVEILPTFAFVTHEDLRLRVEITLHLSMAAAHKAQGRWDRTHYKLFNHLIRDGVTLLTRLFTPSRRCIDIWLRAWSGALGWVKDTNFVVDILLHLVVRVVVLWWCWVEVGFRIQIDKDGDYFQFWNY